MDTLSSVDRDLPPAPTAEERAAQLDLLRRQVAAGKVLTPGEGAALLAIIDDHKANNLAALDRIVEMERELEAEDAATDIYSNIVLIVVEKIFKSGVWTPGPNQTLLDQLQDSVRTMLDERERRASDVRDLAAITEAITTDVYPTNYVIENRRAIEQALAKVKGWCK